MEVSPVDPSLMAMDLSKSFNPLSRVRPEALDLAKKPEWYHRRPAACNNDHRRAAACNSDILGSPYRPRASNSSSFHPSEPIITPVAHCRDMETCPEALGNYMSSTLAPGLDLYREHNGVHGNLWHSGFYAPAERSSDVVPESSGGDESDSGSDVIFLVSSTKEPLLCTNFIQDSVRHIVEPLSPAASSLDDGSPSCYHLPQPLSSPSPDSSYSEDSSDSSVDIPVHHARPVVLLSDLSAVYVNPEPAESPVDVSSDDSDVMEVSVSDRDKSSDSFRCEKMLSCKNGTARETPPQSEDEKVSQRDVRRSDRVKKSVSEMQLFTYSSSRHSLRRQAKNDLVGIYNESCDSDDDSVMEVAMARLCGSDASDKSVKYRVSRGSKRASSHSEEEEEESGVDVKTKKSPQSQESPRRETPVAKSVGHKCKKPAAVSKAKKLRQTKLEQKSVRAARQKKKSEAADGAKNEKKVARRKRKRRQKISGPPAEYPLVEPEIQLRYAKLQRQNREKKSGGFRPFVHMERKKCVVVNYHEDEAIVKDMNRNRDRTRTNSLPGFVPNTSCFQLGRYNTEEKCPDSLLCYLCGQTANAMGLGDLHGPYHPLNTRPYHHTNTGPSVDIQNHQECKSEQKQDLNGLENSHFVDSFSHNDSNGVRTWLDSVQKPSSAGLGEVWIHEDCGIWSTGVFLVRGKLYGLEEAAKLAQETVCASCQRTGAIMGCFQKGCARSYHYRCAIQSGCSLIEDNFSVRCPEHKNKTFTSRTRKQRR